MTELDLRKMFKRGDKTMEEPRDIPPIPLPAEPEPLTRPPLQFLPPNVRNNLDRDVIVKAAEAYDRTEKIIADLDQRLATAIAALEAKNRLIQQLELLLAQERNHSDSHRNARDQAIQDRSDLLGLFGNIQAMLERFELPVPIRRKGKRAELAGNGGATEAKPPEEAIEPSVEPPTGA